MDFLATVGLEVGPGRNSVRILCAVAEFGSEALLFCAWAFGVQAGPSNHVWGGILL